MSLITAQQLCVRIGTETILHDLEFGISPGTRAGLIGPNGSGKTTLLRAISGLIPYEGSLTLQGQEVAAWKARNLAQQLAFVRQRSPLSFDFTVQDIVLLGRSPHKGFLERTTRRDREQVQHALERVDLTGYATRSVLSLSGGECQRVFLAQALVQEAYLLLLDEPTTHLDVHHQYGFLDLVCELVAGGRTSITVFHDIALAARYSNCLFVLDRGHLVASGPPCAILTEALLASVFRMHTQLETTADGQLLIHYQAPVAQDAT